MSTARLSLSALSEKRDGQITNHEDVLGYFGDEPTTIAAVAREAALSPSTVRRYVADLVEGGHLRVSGRAFATGARLYAVTARHTEDGQA